MLGIPGESVAGAFIAGNAGFGSGGGNIGTTPVLVLAVPVSARQGSAAWFSATVSAGSPVYLCAAGVSSLNAPALAAGGTLSGVLFPGDQVWAVTASGTATLSVLQ